MTPIPPNALEELERHARAYAEAKCGISNPGPGCVAAMERAEDAIMPHALSLIASARDLAELQRQLRQAQDHEAETHRLLGAILGTDTSLEDGAKRLAEQLRLANARATTYEQLADRLAEAREQLRVAKAENKALADALDKIDTAYETYMANDDEMFPDRVIAEVQSSECVRRKLATAVADKPHPTQPIADENGMREVLVELEWSAVDDYTFGPACPYCGRLKDAGHSDGCRLAAALAGKE